MVLKRHLGEEDSEENHPFQESKRRLTFESVVRDVMKGLSMQELVSTMEPFLRKVVREELERVIGPFVCSVPRSLPNRVEASGSRGWQLLFMNKLPSTLFTGNKIEAEDNEPVQVVIVDANSKSIVTSGPLSSVKIEILVLNGDFGSDEKEDWTKEEFDECVIREREGRRPLVIGELQINLKGGFGHLGDITFTDNSSWTRSRTFKLGARPVRRSSIEERIREARSVAFVVKDHRGELYKKHHPPSLGDEVWRLEKIGKEGAFHNRLADNGIQTVRDFLRLFVTDRSSLRSILGSNMSSRTWDIIVQHATSCTLDNKNFMYWNAERQVGLLLNSIYEVIGITADGQSFESLDNLTAPQKVLVGSLKLQAYRNLNNMTEFNWPPVNAPPLALPLAITSSPRSNLDVQLTNFPTNHQDQSAVQVGLNNPSNALTYGLENHEHMPDVAVMQFCHPVQPFCPTQRNSFKMKGMFTTYPNDGSQWTPGESSGHFTGDELSQVQMHNWHSAWGQGNGYILASGAENGFGFFSSKRNMGWFKLRAVVKWGISVRRDAAAKRRARCLQLHY